MQVVNLKTHLEQVICHIFSHTLGQGGHQSAFTLIDPRTKFNDQVIDLPLGRPYLHLGVQQAGRTNDLFHHLICFFHLIRTRRGAGVHGDAHHFFKFRELQRTIVFSRRQTKTIIDQNLFPGTVTVVHTAQLGHHHVGFVQNQQVAGGHKVDQGPGRGTLGTLIDMAGIVLNSGTTAYLAQHFQVKPGTLLQALCL